MKTDKLGITHHILTLVTAFGNVENREQVLRAYLLRAAEAPSYYMQVLMGALPKLVDAHLVTARLVEILSRITEYQ